MKLMDTMLKIKHCSNIRDCIAPVFLKKIITMLLYGKSELQSTQSPKSEKRVKLSECEAVI